MRPHSIRLVIGGLGLVWGLASEAVYYRAGTTAYEVLLDLAIGWTYLYGGLALWASRPANRTGRLMTLVGVTWFIGNFSISDIPGLHELGTLFSGVAAAALVALILAYPAGRLETRLDRATVAILALGFLTTNALLLIPVSGDADEAVGLLVVNIALAAFAGLVVIRRWVGGATAKAPRAPARPLRRIDPDGGARPPSSRSRSSPCPRVSKRFSSRRRPSLRPQFHWPCWSGSTARASCGNARCSRRCPT